MRQERSGEMTVYLIYDSLCFFDWILRVRSSVECTCFQVLLPFGDETVPQSITRDTLDDVFFCKVIKDDPDRTYYGDILFRHPVYNEPGQLTRMYLLPGMPPEVGPDQFLGDGHVPSLTALTAHGAVLQAPLVHGAGYAVHALAAITVGTVPADLAKTFFALAANIAGMLFDRHYSFLSISCCCPGGQPIVSGAAWLPPAGYGLSAASACALARLLPYSSGYPP